MNRTIHSLLLLGLLAGGFRTANAQVRFKLSQLSADTYRVSAVPDKTLPADEAITGTMQVTLRVNTADGFVLANVQSALDGVDWDGGSSLRAPDGAAGFDYVSVGLRSVGTRGIDYVAGREVALFTFTNAGSVTARPVLLDNNNDPLTAYQRNRFNVRNHLSVLGYGRLNAWTGNVTDDDTGAGSAVEIRSLSPNPASSRTVVTYENRHENRSGTVSFVLIEAATGRVMDRQTAAMILGLNRAELSVATLSGGTYMIQLEQAGARLGAAAKLLIVR
jgi:hypothetical protein